LSLYSVQNFFYPGAIYPIMEGGVLLRPMLVGRGEELARLIGGLDRAVAGKGSALLVSGEPGMGKTRLSKFMKRQT